MHPTWHRANLHCAISIALHRSAPFCAAIFMHFGWVSVPLSKWKSRKCSTSYWLRSENHQTESIHFGRFPRAVRTFGAFYTKVLSWTKYMHWGIVRMASVSRDFHCWMFLRMVCVWIWTLVLDSTNVECRNEGSLAVSQTTRTGIDKWPFCDVYTHFDICLDTP